MLQLWKARQGRKAALATIAPFVARTHGHLGTIPPGAWHDAYLVGFLSMLASLEAWRKVGPVSSQALGLIQAETLAELSGEVAGVHGEEVCIWNMDQDMDFVEGCRQATLFHAAVEKSGDDHLLSGDQNWPFGVVGDDELQKLWSESFESRLAALR